MDSHTILINMGKLIKKEPRLVIKGFERKRDAEKYLNLLKTRNIWANMTYDDGYKKWYVIYTW